MDGRSNMIAGWILGAMIVALGLGIVTGKMSASHAPETPGFPIEVAASSDAGAVDTGPPFEQLLAEADLAKGEASFAKCVACHTVNQGDANGIGPNLWGVIGAKHGHIAGFAYSDAIASMSGPWDWAAMDAWLASPRRYAPGTKMSFAGIGNPVERANLLAWLNTQGSNLPLPPVPVAAQAANDTEAPAKGEEAAAETAAK